MVKKETGAKKKATKTSKEMKGYGGPVRPVCRLEDLDKDTLVKLCNEYARAYQQMDGHWYDAVAKRYGEKLAREIDFEVWMRNIPSTARRTLEALGHKENDMAGILKVMQFHPAAGGCPFLYDYEVELKSPKVGIVKVPRCHPMRHYRDKGNMDFVRVMCRKWDTEMFGQSAKAIVPNVKWKPLVLPPYDEPYERQEKDIDCMWEFTIDDRR
ncbi:MAG: DUF6125 family protein [Dehalococcoidia bacterium]